MMEKLLTYALHALDSLLMMGAALEKIAEELKRINERLEKISPLTPAKKLHARRAQGIPIVRKRINLLRRFRSIG